MATTPNPVFKSVSRSFRGNAPQSPEAYETLSPESQAGLRQFSLERMTGYGVDYADAIEFRAGVLAGETWSEVGLQLARTAIESAERADPPATRRSRMELYHRASALLRMSQALMLKDDDARREIVARAVDCYCKAVENGLDRRHVSIQTSASPMAGWVIESRTQPALGSVIVIGGVEGWAMDFDSIGDALAHRGMNVLLLDAPGQGETRILNRHYLSPNWLSAFVSAIDFVERTLPGKPIGVIGNSMGGGVALAVANADTRIAACINNGGIFKPSMARTAGETFFAKMVAFCGVYDADEAAAIWDTIEPVRPGPNTTYPLLVIQGGMDPLVSDDHARFFIEQTPVKDKQMESFSDGNHCIYNHLLDRNILMSDWMAARLAEASSPGQGS